MSRAGRGASILTPMAPRVVACRSVVTSMGVMSVMQPARSRSLVLGRRVAMASLLLLATTTIGAGARTFGVLVVPFGILGACLVPIAWVMLFQAAISGPWRREPGLVAEYLRAAAFLTAGILLCLSGWYVPELPRSSVWVVVTLGTHAFVFGLGLLVRPLAVERVQLAHVALLSAAVAILLGLGLTRITVAALPLPCILGLGLLGVATAHAWHRPGPATLRACTALAAGLALWAAGLLWNQVEGPGAIAPPEASAAASHSAWAQERRSITGFPLQEIGPRAPTRGPDRVLPADGYYFLSLNLLLLSLGAWGCLLAARGTLLRLLALAATLAAFALVLPALLHLCWLFR